MEGASFSRTPVKVHVGAILKTLGVSNRTQAALLKTELGIALEYTGEGTGGDLGAKATGT